MKQVVWRWGLVVNESMVTRRLRGVESISMDLETVRLPGEDLFYREELERWGVVVQSLRERRLHHLFVLFKLLCNPCCGRHGVLERRLVQPGHSVRNLYLTRVQQRGPGRSLSLGRVDLVRSLGRSDSLPKDFILCCRDLAVTLSILVLQNGSLSSSSITPGKVTGSVSDWTHVRSLERRKSKWTMGRCGALRRCGSAWTYERTQFLCVKFRLGSAGEPTICSHCYDVLNEDQIFSKLY